MWIFVAGANTLVVREPPAGPEKLSFGLPESTFSKFLSISESCKKSFLTEGFRPRNRIETTNAFLDSLLPQIERKIAPERFLFGNRCDICIFVIGLPNFLTAQLKSSFPRQPYYFSSRKGSTSHVDIRCVGECTLVVREPPARPEKLSCLSPEGTFPKS